MRSWLVPGESDFVQLFWGVLTHSDMLTDLLKTFAMSCMHVHVSDASVWLSSLSGLPMCGSAPLAGRSGVIDTFSGVLVLFSLLCVRACMADVSVLSLGFSGSPTHNTALLAGMPGLVDIFRSSRAVPTATDVCAGAQHA